MNHMLHIAAATQVRLDTEGRAHYRRKLAEGQDPHGGHAVPEEDASLMPSTANSLSDSRLVRI
jgi:hypothetical protein